MRFLVLLLLLPLLASSQLFDNFNDGEFLSNPQWHGSVNNFKINSNQQLQLYTSGEGSSYLSTPIYPTHLHEWSFFIKCSFSPSDNNHTLIYLAADNQNPQFANDAFYLKLGEGGSDDAIELYRQDTVTHLLGRSKAGSLKDPFSIRIKIKRDDGMWEVLADSTGGTDYKLQFTANDDHWIQYSWFILNCKYTSSNATKFYFDEIYAGPTIVDNFPPQVDQLIVNNEQSLSLKFSELLLPEYCSVNSNFLLNTNRNPIAAGRDESDHSMVHLLFDTMFNEGITYALNVKGLKDLEGNIMNDTIIHFQYHRLRAFDVTINEIMADPDPPVEISGEYIELHNRTDCTISLDGWTLQINESHKEIPSVSIKPHSYLLLVPPSYDSLMSKYGEVLALEGLKLDNTGARLVLRSREEAVVHSIEYSSKNYMDDYKQDGGWSMEMIDPFNPCGNYSNWHASTDKRGGSPCMINSVIRDNRDSTIPEINFISMPDEKSITLHFTESMDSSRLMNPLKYSVEPSIGYPMSVSLHPPAYDAVTLAFENRFLNEIRYVVTCCDTLTDCAGNILPVKSKAEFGVPNIINSKSIVINEVMFDTSDSDAEFVEIYNSSDSVFHLKDIYLAELNPVSGQIKKYSGISSTNRIFLPGTYLVLTENPDAVRDNHLSGSIQSFIQMNEFPSLSNSGGTIALVSTNTTIIDQMSYNEDMHFALLNDTKGVSLERVNPNRPSSDINNWQSASQNSGYATPGIQNSQYCITPVSSNGHVTIEPLTFSPDNDGYDDKLFIVYKSESPGKLITIRIFNHSGLLVKTISGNYYAGMDNLFTWDGITDEGTKASNGIYIVHTQACDINGAVSVYKDVIVVASR